MKTMIDRIKPYIRGTILLLAGGYLLGCSSEQPLDEPVDEPAEQTEVRFFTSVATRAESADNAEKLTDQAKVRLYPYRQKTGVSEPTLIKDYTVQTDAQTQQLQAIAVSGSSAIPMILPSGTFNFYAVSTNSDSDDVPVFHTGDAVNGIPSSVEGYAAVKNGVDYLYAKAQKAIAFGTATTDVPLQFSHKGTQVQLTIIFGENAQAADETAAANANFADAEVKLQVTSETDAKMYLIDGNILFGSNQSAGLPGSDTDLKQMTVRKVGEANGVIPANQIATYHLLPLKANSAGQKMKIQITVQGLKLGPEGTAATRIYTGKLDASGGWAVGTSNQYTLTLSGTEIHFSTVTVVPWADGSSGGEVGDIENTSDGGTTTETTP